MVVDKDPSALAQAEQRGVATVTGDATRSDVLSRAGVPHASGVVLATPGDDTNAFLAASVHDLAPQVRIAGTAQERGNLALLRWSGLGSVVVTEEVTGRLLAVAAADRDTSDTSHGNDRSDEGTPAGRPCDADNGTAETAREIRERSVTPAEVGRMPTQLDDVVLCVVRNHSRDRTRRGAGVPDEALGPGDRLLYLPRTGQAHRLR